MKVLVLGGNRYIGLSLLFELARQGHEITVVNSHEAAMPPGTRRLHGDRHEPGKLAELLTPYRDEFDAVFDNTSYQPEHLAPVLDLFRGRVKHFVFTSSIAVYNFSDVQPVTEDFPVTDDPRQAIYGQYGAYKVRCERLLIAEHRENGLPVTCMRVTHSLGPKSPAVSREPGTFMRLEQGRPLIIGGRTDAIVHFIHIDDVASALCAVLGKEQAIGQVYNVAGSEFCSIMSYMKLMGKAVGVDPTIMTIPPSLATTTASPIVHWLEANHGSMIFSIDKARRDLGWEPRFTLESGLADSYRWFSAGGRDRYSYDFSIDDAVLAEIEKSGDAGPIAAAKQGFGGNLADVIKH